LSQSFTADDPDALVPVRPWLVVDEADWAEPPGLADPSFVAAGDSQPRSVVRRRGRVQRIRAGYYEVAGRDSP
jgi:hypothetical protein